jgi:hypothetical protein
MHKDDMTLTVTAYGKTVSITVPDDIDMLEFLDICHNLGTSIGYHEDSWKEAVIEMANEYLKEEEHEVERNLRDYGNYTVKTNQKVYTGKSNELTNWTPLYDSNC